MTLELVFDPPDTPFPTHHQRVTLMGLVGRKGAKAFKEATSQANIKPDITTATKSQLDHLIALMSYYPDLEDKWQRKRRRK